MPVIKAHKVEVEADSIKKTKTPKLHQTNTHNAQLHKAEKNVEVRIQEQYPVRGSNAERPRPGTTIKGDQAVISSRKTTYLGPADVPKRTKGIFKDNVTISMRSSGSSQPKRKAPSRGNSKRR